jgi:23S rRNA pseudouridine2605 synthase
VSVGRFDINTSGLMLFTDDGELANKLMHPSSGIDREYLVRIQGEVTDEIIQHLKDGVELEDGPARFTDIVRSRTDSGGANTWYHCAVMEGRNREVRRLWESQDLRVSRLKRVRFGPLVIPPFVRNGQWIDLSEKEMAELHRRVGLTVPRRKKFDPVADESQKRHIKRLRSSGKAISKGARSSPKKKH